MANFFAPLLEKDKPKTQPTALPQLPTGLISHGGITGGTQTSTPAFTVPGTQPSVGVKEVVREIPQATKQVFGGIANALLPASVEFVKTTGQVIGEGLAYAVDKNVREMYGQGYTEILPRITTTNVSDIYRKTGAAALESSLYALVPGALGKSLVARFGQGYLEGVGFAVSEGVAKGYDKQQIIENAKRYAKFGGAAGIVAPYMMKLLSTNLDEIPKAFKSAFRGLAEEGQEAAFGMSIRKVGGNLDPDDASILRKYIDAIRLKGQSVAPDMTEADFTNAERIFQKLGISLNTSETKLANAAEDILTGKIKAAPLYTPDVVEDIIPPVKPPKVRGNIEPPELDFKEWKDASALSLNRETLERNLDRLAPKQQAAKLKTFIVEPIRQNETLRVTFNNALRKETEERVVTTLGIKGGSKEDALVQAFGEKSITLDELKKQTPQWEKVVEASRYFREKYDGLLDTVNAVRAQFGYKPIAKREDYFRHFQELDGIIRNFGVILREQDLPTEISGITEFFRPGKPFSTAELQRKGGSYTLSAIRGFDNYIDSISKQIFHIDSVQRARGLEKYIRDAGEAGEAKLPNFVANLKEYGNLLAGKKSTFDRAFESMFGRRFYTAMNMVRTRTSANMVGLNISSAFTNFIPFTQAAATTEKMPLLRGALESTIAPFQSDPTMIGGVKSSFLTRRFPEGDISPKVTRQVKEAFGWLFGAIDKFTSKSVVAGKFYEQLGQGLSSEEAMKVADNYAGKVITDRSLGQLPNLFNVKTLGPITQFQAEINNMYSFLAKDIPALSKNKAKVVSALTQFFVYSYLYNTVFEKVAGRRPTLDPIHFLLTAAGPNDSESESRFTNTLQTLNEDILQSLPFLGGLTGGRLPVGAGLPNVPKIIKGEANVGKELIKPLFFLAPPAGGLQIKKTLEGLAAYSRGAVRSASGKTELFEIKRSPENFVRSILFGKWATPEARKYFETR